MKQSSDCHEGIGIQSYGTFWIQLGSAAGEICRLLRMISPPTLIANLVKWDEWHETFLCKTWHLAWRIGQHLFTTHKIKLPEFPVINGGESCLFLLHSKTVVMSSLAFTLIASGFWVRNPDNMCPIQIHMLWKSLMRDIIAFTFRSSSLSKFE